MNPREQLQLRFISHIHEIRPQTPLGYETKFAQFIKGCAGAKDSGTQQMIIAQPWVIGDTYEEVMESLSRLSQAGLALHVVEPLPKSERN